MPCKISTISGTEISWKESMRYLGIYLIAGKTIFCSLDNAKHSFYRAFNAVFGKIGRIASEEVVVQLLNLKCLPVLLYGLEICLLTKSQRNSLDFVIVSCFMKIFNTKSKEIV